MPTVSAPPNYRLERLLGSGQTSRVYLAGHERYGSLALKLLRQDVRQDPVLTRMFENEVQLTLGLSHQSVIAAYDGFPTGPEAYLALEYCPGGTLDQVLKSGAPLSPPQAYRLILEVGRGLEHCHERRVLHRDVKPSNIFLTATGESKLGDFGTGIYLTSRDQDRVGTAFYMAPEIFRGEGASVRSDVYSLGVVAFELLAGERPFTGTSYDELMLAHSSSLPKNLAHLRPEVNREVARVVARAMSRDPDRRFDSARAFGAAFGAAFRAAFVQAVGLEPEPSPSAEEHVVGRAGRSLPRASQPQPQAREKEKRGLARWFGRKKR